MISPLLSVCVKTQAKGSNCFLTAKNSRRCTSEWRQTGANWALPLPLSVCPRRQRRPEPRGECLCLLSDYPAQEEAGEKQKKQHFVEWITLLSLLISVNISSPNCQCAVNCQLFLTIIIFPILYISQMMLLSRTVASLCFEEHKG